MKHLLFPFMIMALLAACHSSKKSEHLPKVQVEAPKEIIAPLKKYYIGITKPVIQVVLRARVEGFLEKRLFQEGSLVHKDETLFTIEKAPFEAQLLSAKGNLEKAKADLSFQEVQFKRYQSLVQHQNISKSQYDQQYAQYLSALGQLDAAQGSYEQARLNLAYTDVISPINGMVGKALIDVGNLVSGANKTELVKIVQLNPLRVEFNPSISDLKEFAQYQKNQPFPVEVSLQSQSNKLWSGVVDFYNNDADENTSTLLLRTTIVNSDNLLRPDYYVKVAVILDPKHRIKLVPYNKIVDVQGLRQLLVLNKDHRMAWRELSLGQIQDGMAEIVSGLEEGDLVVLDQQSSYQEGQKLEPIINQTAKEKQ